MSQTAKAAGEARVDMMTDSVNLVIVHIVIPTKWELGIITNYYKGNGNSSERRNRKRLELTDYFEDSWENYWQVAKTAAGHWWDAVWSDARIWN